MIKRQEFEKKIDKAVHEARRKVHPEIPSTDIRKSYSKCSISQEFQCFIRVEKDDYALTRTYFHPVTMNNIDQDKIDRFFEEFADKLPYDKKVSFSEITPP